MAYKKAIAAWASPGCLPVVVQLPHMRRIGAVLPEGPPQRVSSGPGRCGFGGRASARDGDDRDGPAVLRPGRFIGTFYRRAFPAIADRRHAAGIDALPCQEVLGGGGATVAER